MTIIRLWKKMTNSLISWILLRFWLLSFFSFCPCINYFVKHLKHEFHSQPGHNFSTLENSENVCCAQKSIYSANFLINSRQYSANILILCKIDPVFLKFLASNQPSLENYPNGTSTIWYNSCLCFKYQIKNNNSQYE